MPLTCNNITKEKHFKGKFKVVKTTNILELIDKRLQDVDTRLADKAVKKDVYIELNITGTIIDKKNGSNLFVCPEYPGTIFEF